MTHLGTKVLETERLLLRPYRLSDAGAMYKNWASDPEVTRFLTWPTHESAEVTEKIIALWLDSYAKADSYHWGIELKSKGELIGDIAVVSLAEHTAEAELGWALGRAYWGQGIMPEAARAVMRFLFEEVGFNRIMARHDTNNPKSGRVMLKAGMRREGTMRGAGKNNTGIVDIEVYAALKDEWLSGSNAYNGANIYHAERCPVLEFDENPVAKLNPAHFASDKFKSDKLVITFFPEVLDKLKARGLVTLERVIGGENPVEIYEFDDGTGTYITLGQIGCPACGGNLDLFNAMGISKAIFCGGGGVLDKNIKVGQLLLVDGAIRDEGFSYQYVKASRVIYSDAAHNAKIAAYLDLCGVSYLRGLVWTTDALFRETESRILRRKAEGAKIVEMEQAGCIAVANTRGFDYGALIYGGDDVSQQEWSNRAWRSREGIRYDLVLLCKDILNDI